MGNALGNKAKGGEEFGNSIAVGRGEDLIEGRGGVLLSLAWGEDEGRKRKAF